MIISFAREDNRMTFSDIAQSIRDNHESKVNKFHKSHFYFLLKILF